MLIDGCVGRAFLSTVHIDGLESADGKILTGECIDGDWLL